MTSSWPRISLACRSTRSISISGTTFCLIQVAGQIDFALQQLQRFGQLGFGRLYSSSSLLRWVSCCASTSMSCASLRARASNTALLGMRQLAAQLPAAPAETSTCRLPAASASSRATRAAIARAAFADFAEFGRELGVLDAHQRLALLHDGAFLNQDLADDAAFERLHDLRLARRDHPAVAALDFVEHREMRPDQRRPRTAPMS